MNDEEFKDMPEEIRRLLPREVIDMGHGKAIMSLDDGVVTACRDAQDYCAEVIEKSVAMAASVKDNGADFAETWAGLLALGKSIPTLTRAPEVMLTYLITALAFKEEK